MKRMLLKMVNKSNNFQIKVKIVFNYVSFQKKIKRADGHYVDWEDK